MHLTTILFFLYLFGEIENKIESKYPCTKEWICVSYIHIRHAVQYTNVNYITNPSRNFICGILYMYIEWNEKKKNKWKEKWKANLNL